MYKEYDNLTFSEWDDEVYYLKIRINELTKVLSTNVHNINADNSVIYKIIDNNNEQLEYLYKKYPEYQI